MTHAVPLSEWTCSKSSWDAGEPLAGTAPYAAGWIVLEDPGPWGRDALADSSVPSDVVARCRQLLDDFGIRTILARHANRRRLPAEAARHVWLAHCSTTTGALHQAMVGRLTDVLEWDLEGLARGQFPTQSTPVDGPLEFICTHSGRDRCCAQLGRARAALRPHAWECSHLGGHRFAATSLVLPSGQLFGRLDATSSDDLTTRSLRGASYLTEVEQVADIAVRQRINAASSEPLRCWLPETVSAQALVHVADQHGREWSVLCERRDFLRSASCGSEPACAATWVAVSVNEG